MFVSVARRSRRSLTVMSFVLLASCAAPVTEVPLDTGFTLHQGDSALVSGTGLLVVFDSVLGDSRCPQDVVCVWAGSAPIRLRLRGAADTTLTLDPTQGPHEAVVRDWRLAITGLVPAPTAGVPIPPASYEAHLRLTGAGGS